MATTEMNFLREQIEERRKRIEAALAGSPQGAGLRQLIEEVDAALERMNEGSYGICESCHDSIEKDRLLADPLVRYCLDHLTPEQQRALEKDLELAARIQRTLLPPPDLRVAGWEAHYRYQPAGPVSGDYCDLIPSPADGGGLTFMVGDVSGKGVAASLLMSQLHAMFRSLTTAGVALSEIVALANRVFCESTMAGQYATLVCGRANRSGELEICSAGHCPPLVVRRGEIAQIQATGLPLGMFSDGKYAFQKTELEPGDTLFLYTDGLTEQPGRSGSEYGLERLTRLVSEQGALRPQALATHCLDDLKAFAAGTTKTDDLTVMVIRRLANSEGPR
jgi:sigma-B regulation protein RsbU (phosphoserine phosphatase)